MARVTVEDCIKKIPNRFELVLIASQRARDIASGAELTVERDNDKNPVVALREIAAETVELDKINESLIRSLQKHLKSEETEQEEDEIQFIGDNFTGETVNTLEPGAGKGAKVAAKGDGQAVDENGRDASGDESLPEKSNETKSDEAG